MLKENASFEVCVFMTPAQDPKQCFWEVWEVSEGSFEGSRSSGLSRGTRGVSEAIIPIIHTSFSIIP